MSFPIVPDKHRLSAMLTAEQMIEFRRAHGGLAGDAPRGVVICLYTGIMPRFRWRYRSRRVKGWRGDLYLIDRTARRVGVLGNIGIGAPAIVNAAEELLAWGTKRLIILSLAGGLRSDLAPGTIVVCDRAIRDEGTSYHYLAPARDVRASPELVAAISRTLERRGLARLIGATWSTDAPYRETREEVEQFKGEGVIAVDMESAGLFAAGMARGAEVASAFVIADSLAGPRWTSPPDMRVLHERLKVLLDALIDVLHSDGGSPNVTAAR
jgi:uridine phosphorylase